MLSGDKKGVILLWDIEASTRLGAGQPEVPFLQRLYGMRQLSQREGGSTRESVETGWWKEAGRARRKSDARKVEVQTGSREAYTVVLAERHITLL